MIQYKTRNRNQSVDHKIIKGFVLWKSSISACRRRQDGEKLPRIWGRSAYIYILYLIKDSGATIKEKVSNRDQQMAYKMLALIPPTHYVQHMYNSKCGIEKYKTG